ncbi:spore germination protein [Neobacillus sp. WH10]|uniref:spore germination protein n=1 Tax=Neobacillus sp. WH10 TaxID=3047873 RepID=UPI0024C1142F|nr:spore germination protein [Neobacillus sp. WH10]WHY76871.1 spore germination protein [Neobacillus sp. WH10]
MMFKKEQKKTTLNIAKSPDEKDIPTAAKSLNEQTLRELFKKNEDVKFEPFTFNQHKVMLTYCQGLVRNEMLYQTVPERLEALFSQLQVEPSKEKILELLRLPSLKLVENEDEAVSEIFSGKLLLNFNIPGSIFLVDISERPQRNPEETKTEVSILGPRDNFIEDISINIALIRKRLRTTSLASKSLEIGRRTRTKVSVLYIDDITNKEILQNIMEKLSAIDIDGLFSGTQLEELLDKNPFGLFPRHAYSGRPDFAVQSLLNGRIIILIDGIAYAYITPVNLFYLLKSTEDKEQNYAFNSFERLMRVFGILVATFLPGFWVALSSFHQNQLPLTLLATIVESRRGVPLPTALEALLMLLIFELFREAGLRLPTAVGQTLSVIGGLIIGDAAIRAGLTNPAMLVVISGSTIATFTLVNQWLIGTISIIRFFVIFCVSLFGFFGFFISIYIILIYIAKIRIFGVPYLGLVTRIDMMNILKTVFRLPDSKKVSRVNSLNPNDPTRKEGKS